MGKHYVPQKYLEGFAVPGQEKSIWQYDKKTDSFSGDAPISIRRVAQEAVFYDSEIENSLADKIERPANLILDKLRVRDFDLSAEERLQLALYIATMIKRVPKNRERGRNLAPKTLTAVCEQMRETVRSAACTAQISKASAENYLVQIDSSEAQMANQIPQEVIDQIDSPWPSLEMIAMVNTMVWRFVITDDPHHFLTSDNPVYFFEGWGLRGSEYAELAFPISSAIALFGSWQPLSQNASKLRKGAKFVKEANNRLASGATRFVFSRAKALWISKIAHKPVEKMSRIVWRDFDRTHVYRVA